MSEKYIDFSTPMVKAILEGRKTQTRRPVKPQPTVTDAIRCCNGVYEFSNETFTGTIQRRQPKYDCGDVLWVRETWQKKDCNECPVIDYPCALPIFPCIFGDREYLYKADPDSKQPLNSSKGECACELYEDMRWRSPIHMKREAARIFLRVTDVRAERLQEISDKDCVSEGMVDNCKPCTCKNTFSECDTCHLQNDVRADYAQLWDSLYSKKGYGWDSNLWVWVYEFERVSGQGKGII